MVGGQVTDTPAGGVAEVDQLVAGIAPLVGHSPGVETRDAVLVTGPWLAGATSLITALRERLPEHTFVETADLGVTEAPKAVVFVAPAVAPATDSDFALLDLAAANTDLVIGVVSKIDLHLGWQKVLDADKTGLAAHAHRYRDVPWVGAAAAPDGGEPNVDELVETLRQHLADSALARRNRLRAWEIRLIAATRRCEEEANGASRDARMAELREQRDAAVRQGELDESERSTGLQGRIQQVQAQLANFGDSRCTSVSDELKEDVSSTRRLRRRKFEAHVRKRVDEVVAEVNAGVTKDLGDVATEFGLTPPANPAPPPSPEVTAPPRTSRTLQTMLIGLLGVLLGAGLAVAVCLLVVKPPMVYTAGAAAAGGLVGLAIALWVARMGRSRRQREMLDRWVDDIITELREAVERLVPARVPPAGEALASELTEVDEAAAARLADRVSAIDVELRDHGLAAARADTRRTRDLPALKSALHAVRSELGYEQNGHPEAGPEDSSRESQGEVAEQEEQEEHKAHVAEDEGHEHEGQESEHEGQAAEQAGQEHEHSG